MGQVYKVFNILNQSMLGLSKPNKNMFNNFLQMAVGQIKVSIIITLCLDWGLIIKRHQRASVNGVDTSYQLQMASIKSTTQRSLLIAL
jgi:hypothetical protein